MDSSHRGLEIDLSDADRARLRNIYQTVLISQQSRAARTMHIPPDDMDETDPTPLCGGGTAKAWRLKSIAVYPLGYLEWCDFCVQKSGILEGANE